MSSTIDKEDVLIIDALVAAARASGLSRFSGSFSSTMPMHKSGYSIVKFTWERGRHGDRGTTLIEWNATLRMHEAFTP
jgi:hypothetical protein